MMNDQQQPLAAVCQRCQHGAQQWPLSQVQAALGLIGQAFQRLAINTLANP